MVAFRPEEGDDDDAEFELDPWGLTCAVGGPLVVVALAVFFDVPICLPKFAFHFID